MTTRPKLLSSPSKGWLAARARGLFGAVVVAGVAALAVATTAVLAITVLTMFAIFTALGLMLYVIARLRRPAPGKKGPLVLDARRAGAGWTVDAVGR